MPGDFGPNGENLEMEDINFEGRSFEEGGAMEDTPFGGRSLATDAIFADDGDTRRSTNAERELADCIVRGDDLDDLRMWLDLGADVNARLRHGLTPLHYAVWQNYLEAATLLLEAGCDINAKDNIGYSPMHIAAEHGFVDMIKLLLKRNATINFNTPADYDEEFPLSASDEPLRLAIKHNRFEAVELLLERGANPHTKYFFGAELNLVNPLNSDIIRLLLSHGADPNARDRHGFTPLMKACRLQQGMETCLILISYGADPNMRTNHRHDIRSVLHYAVLSGSVAIANLLIKQGADVVFEEGYNKATPLHLAILKGDFEMTKLLVDAGADVNATSSVIGSPLHMACSEGVQNRMEILEHLLKNKADPNLVIMGEDGSPVRPPLMDYLNNDVPHYDVVNMMLRYGAEVVMQSQTRNPNGVLNCIPNLSKYPKVLIEVLEAGQKFDIPFIMTSSLIDKDQREVYIKVAQNPLSLKHSARILLRQHLGTKMPQRIDELDLPHIMKKYLLYEIS